MSKLFTLFWEFFRLSLFVIGGGYAIIAVADEMCAKRGWTEEGELLDHLPIFQSIPGLIAAHTAVYVGNKVAGTPGAAVAVLAVALPSVAIFSLVAIGYRALPLGNEMLKSAFVGLRAALAGIVAAAIVRGWRRSLPDAFSYVLCAAAVLAVGFLGFGVVPVLVVAMLAGIASHASGGGDVSGRRTFRSSGLALLVFLKYGLVGFGGGFALVPLYVADFVGPAAACLHVTAEEFADVMALSQMTPGPIGVNCATFFGYRMYGLPGAIAASVLLLLPGAVLCLLAVRSLERFRGSRVVAGIMRGVRPASVALMLCALRIFAENIWYNITAILIATATMVLVMKKKTNVVALIILSAFAALALRADEPVNSARFPDADAVLVDETERVRYNPDGTYETTIEAWTKILTEKGRRDESTQRLRYSRRYGEAKIVFVRAIGEDGCEREIDVSATTKESTDNGEMSANIYDPLDRVIVCTIPGLKVGDTLHVKTCRRTTKPRCRDKWADLAVMEWSMPVLRSTFEVTAPAARPLKRIAIRHPLGNVVTNVARLADGSLVHTFVATNSPQAFSEPDMPPLFTQVQHVRVSTAADWPEISRWYWDLCAPHLAKTNAAMCAKVAELGHDVRAVFKFVSQEVRYMGLTMEDTSPGYAPHDVDVTFDNRYGVCRDKAGLLVTMLRLAGFKAFPVLIHVGAKHDPEVPQPFFNHAIVAVEREDEPGKYDLMDPTNENAKDLFPSYLCDKSYLVCRPEGEVLKTSEVVPPDRNSLDVETSGKLAKDGSLFVESEIRFGGINDTAYRGALVRRQPGDRVKFFEKVVRGMAPGAELVRCDVEPKDMRDTERPVVVRLAARLPEAVLRGETRDELVVPFLSGSLGMANFLLVGNTSLAQRRYPLVLDTTAKVSESVCIDIGDSLGMALELPKETRGGLSGYRFERSFSVTNGELRATRSLTIGAVEFSPAEYGALREEIKRVEAASRRRPVFAEDPLRDADSRCLLSASETTIFSDRAWTTTNTVVREVLTYAAKKKFAELKFSFNPAVEAVELLSASVSNRNGEVRFASDREKNIMDCGWAAAAPRYPAGRLLVVNLPAVEIGSLISYTFVRTVTNAPVAFYAEYGFDSTEPLDRRIVRVNDWRREVTLPRRVPKESDQPDAAIWRDVVIVSSNKFGKVDLDIGVVDPEKALGEAVGGDGDAERRILAVRDWMAKYVKIAGPGLWELPISLQRTPPETVLRERYATRLDYVCTLCTLLRGAGLDADVVFASSDADEPEEVKLRIMRDKPNVRAFSAPLCRVMVREGGFLGFGGTERTFFVGTESQYAPLGPSAYEGSDYFDPSTGGFGVVSVPEPEFSRATRESSEYDIRADGSVDLTVIDEIAGPGVAAFRKTYSEILPEERARRHQRILGNIAQAATATSDLETDVESYPATRRFSCYIPDFAIVQDGAITIQLPALASSIPAAAGSVRQTPFAMGACAVEEEVVTVRFPEGYGTVEHLPASFTFADPADPSVAWMESAVSSSVGEDGRLAVTIRRMIRKRGATWYRPEFHELIKDWRRIATSRSNRTITVRRR